LLKEADLVAYTEAKRIPTLTSYIISQYTIDVQNEFAFALEQHKSSLLSGSLNGYNMMDMVSALQDLKPWYYSFWDVANKHGASAKWYFWSKSFPATLEYKRNLLGQIVYTGKVAASASTSDARIKEMTGMNMTKWSHYEGTYTCSPTDDSFEQVLNLEDGN